MPLGLVLHRVSSSNAIIVGRVAEDGLAAAAGMFPGDEIVRCDRLYDEPLTIANLAIALQKHSSCVLTVRRNGGEIHPIFIRDEQNNNLTRPGSPSLQTSGRISPSPSPSSSSSCRNGIVNNNNNNLVHSNFDAILAVQQQQQIDQLQIENNHLHSLLDSLKTTQVATQQQNQLRSNLDEQFQEQQMRSMKQAGYLRETNLANLLATTKEQLRNAEIKYAEVRVENDRFQLQTSVLTRERDEAVRKAREQELMIADMRDRISELQELNAVLRERAEGGR